MFPLPLFVSSPRILLQIKPNYSCRMHGLPPRPVSILFLVVMTVVGATCCELMFLLFRFKEASRNLQVQQ